MDDIGLTREYFRTEAQSPVRPTVGLSRQDFVDTPPVSFEETEYYKKWSLRTKGKPVNDFLTVVSASSKTSGSGSGKTTLATTLAELCDQTEDGFDAEERGTTDAGELAYNILPNIEQGAAVIYDEAQGAPGSDSVSSRRSMTAEAVDAINAILANRDMGPTIIMVGQQLGMLDKLLYHMIDAWLLIVRDPKQIGGPVAVHHELATNDYDLDNKSIKTPAIEDLEWRALPEDNENFQIMEHKKQLAKRRKSDSEDEGTPIEELPKRLRDEKITRLYENGVEQAAIASAFDITQTSVSRICSGKQ